MEEKIITVFSIKSNKSNRQFEYNILYFTELPRIYDATKQTPRVRIYQYS